MYTHILIQYKAFLYGEKDRMNRMFLCKLINEQKFVCKIRCFKHQKQHRFAICDLFTLAPRFKTNFFRFQFTVIVHYTPLLNVPFA